MKKNAKPPRLPDEPYANIRASDGRFIVSWGLGWVRRGIAWRRSINAAIRLRDRRLRQMTVKYDWQKRAEQALEEFGMKTLSHAGRES